MKIIRIIIKYLPRIIDLIEDITADIKKENTNA